ncbi:MAG TPA: helix-turn-helix transcriptional regulator [Verrucomicrobiae bacterium]|nr:helix-turn-helix transcriptional regulator [Verrucomicrobiae bacterium]
MNVVVRAVGLRTVRRRNQLTQRELARQLGVTQNYIPALESGARNPGPRLRAALLTVFQCTFEELFEVVVVDPATRVERRLGPLPDSTPRGR